MPIYLDEKDLASELTGFKSVLIVPCRFCPAASMAVSHSRPYIELFRRFLKTAPYEELIQKKKRDLENSGIKTDVFESRIVHQFVLCMWTTRRRNKLSEVAQNYDAVVVMGCEGAVQSVRNSIDTGSCNVIQGMTSRGLMSLKPSFHLPGNISLELESVSPVGEPAPEKELGRMCDQTPSFLAGTRGSASSADRIRLDD